MPEVCRKLWISVEQQECFRKARLPSNLSTFVWVLFKFIQRKEEFISIGNFLCVLLFIIIVSVEGTVALKKIL